MMIIPTFLKWAGGKRRLIKQIDKHLPEKIDRYFEPFLGAGSMFFYIKQKYNPKFCMISDINKDLIETYVAVRDNPKILIRRLKYFKNRDSDNFYYETRLKLNNKKFSGIKKSAAFIYLNKTCFNGLYRVNSKGEFNVPRGRYKNPKIYDEEIIIYASKLLQKVEIKCQDYEKIKKYVGENDFIYLDPCYDPLKKTSFANYTSEKFCDKDNVRLSLFISELKKRGGRVMLSNNVTNRVEELYPAQEYHLEIVLCSRPINSQAHLRGKIQEYLIMNY